MSYTVLVTGGCGFIGANFVRFLLTERPDWRVVNIDKLTYAGNQANLVGLADTVGGVSISVSQAKSSDNRYHGDRQETGRHRRTGDWKRR